MIKHSDEHMTEVCAALGIAKPGADARLAGIEIETGWQTEPRRAAFFKDIERFGISNDAISKYDGTIGSRGSTSAAEIVSRPMSFNDLRKFVDKAGKIIESKADKGLVTTGCGVHIHVSEGLFGTDALWRYAASMCHNPEVIAEWLYSKITPEATKQSRLVHHFWDDVSLRTVNKNSLRTPYKNVKEIPKTISHSRAFIHGQATPTYETRIFRTPKSRRVLLSYIDVIESLLEFSTTASDDLFEKKSGIDPEKVRELERTTAPLLSVSNTTAGPIFYDRMTGEQYDPKMVHAQPGSSDGRLFYYFYKGSRLRIPTDDEVRFMMSANKNKGARGWVDGVIPLRAYIQHVMDRRDKYPHLAQRLAYDKFAVYRGDVQPQKEVFEHRDKEHMEFCEGCLARIEESKGEIFQIKRLRSAHGNRLGMASCEVEVITDDDNLRGNYYEYPINVLIHACKGALEAGGEL
jgi:hypothetical protein